MGDDREGNDLRRHLQAALKAALKAGDTAATAALRSAISAIDNAEAVAGPHGQELLRRKIAKARVGVGVADVARREMSRNDIAEILRAEVTDRTAAAAVYERMGRVDRAAALRREAAALEAVLDDRRQPPG